MDPRDDSAKRLKVAVTGSSGKVGRATLEALRTAGHRVASFDIRPCPDVDRTTLVDFCDYGQVVGALAGVDTVGGGFDAVVHLAGIPSPGLASDHRVFENNTLSTYNVFQACRSLGIGRIVWASSETLLGLPFEVSPPFAPLDESVMRPEWSYSLSKQLGEVMAETYARWSPGTSISSMRFSNVYLVEDYANMSTIQAQPGPRRANLWSYVDARDCGQACRLAVEQALPGHEAYVIAADDTIMNRPSADLMREYFPDVPLRPLGTYQSLISSEKAKRMLSYRPGYSWRDHV